MKLAGIDKYEVIATNLYEYDKIKILRKEFLKLPPVIPLCPSKE
jgi:hypothetical protein